jgi:hypothetical protein
MRRRDGLPPGSTPAPLPAAASWTAALVLVGAALVWALGVEPRRRSDPVRPPAAPVATAVRDVLTGRLLASDGRPMAPEAGLGSAGQPIRLRFVPSTDH